ncbi:cation:proton antiporter [Spirochaeta africana]|uniref:Kef-type K+ transport system, membrane component n=1 Tax=Spirochaeta africana (strain ATCC 700263 / DSM 8902 / Z-7692) TaxID=889378 RepID=H9UI56_SPIAZ|nr:cation:proton antiporter [Spirochaeta africana]AFG37199.1 Kef-type K+ transport system, membrane component [Spirochaeta africana DSM 8902]
MKLPFSDPVLIFATVMMLILLAPLVARRIRLPEIVGLLLAGMLFGPFGLGLLERDATIQLLGQVGLLYIMFLAGLEIDLHQVKQQRSHSLVFGLLTFSIPLALGTWLGIWSLGMAIPTAVLMSTMFSSHTLLTFPAVGKLGLTKTRAVTTTIGGTIITDTLALLVLAVIAASTEGELDTRFWVSIGISMTLYVVGVVLLVPIIGRWFLQRFSSDENIEFASVLAITFLAGYLAHVAGLEPIIGAFLAGLTLNSLIPEKSGLMAKIHFTGNALFIPFFLLSVGMLVNLELLLEGPSTWVVIAVMVGVAIVSKLAAAYASGGLLRYSLQESGLIYGLSVNQAAATLAAALVGYEIGLFDDSIITGTIVMIGVTCFFGPIVTEHFGRRLAEQREQQSLTESDGAPHRVLLAVDRREQAKELLELGFFLRSGNSHEPLYPVHVVPEGSDTEERVARGEKLLAHTVVRALAANVPVSPSTSVDVNVTSGILRAARENRASIIALYWDGQPAGRGRVFGRSIDTVIERGKQMVVVNRIVSPLNICKRIILVIPPLAERQAGFSQAIQTVKTLANQSGTRLQLMIEPGMTQPVRKFIESVQPAVAVSLVEYRAARDILYELPALVATTDWIILLAARMGRISWQPRIDRLPHQLSQQFPTNNLTCIYPPEEQLAYRQAFEKRLDRGFFQQVFPQEHVVLNSSAGSIHQLLEKLLAGEFPRKQLKPMLARLQRISETEPVELISDVVLLHDHIAGIDEPRIFLGVCRKPLQLPLVRTAPHVVVVLLAPHDQDPARHLATLADIARIIRTPGMAASLRDTGSYTKLVQRVTDEHNRQE